jgi:hypothetical protein
MFLIVKKLTLIFITEAINRLNISFVQHKIN